MKLAAIALFVGTLLTVEQRDPHRATLDQASAAVSADGRFIAFVTYFQLVTADNDISSDVYVLDRVRHHVTLESADTRGISGDTERPAINGDGRYVIFERAACVWLRDRITGITTMVAEGQQPAISENGAVVVFSAPGLDRVADADLNGDKSDIYAIDVASGHARRISLDMPGFDASLAASVQPSVSADGRYVASTSRLQPAGGRSAHRTYATGSIVAFSSHHTTDASDKRNDSDLYVATLQKKRRRSYRTAAHYH